MGRQRVLGALLAGGRSRRFGSDKALAELDGQRLIDRSIAALSAHVDALLVCGRDYPGMRCLADRPRPDLGPLGGLNAALHVARAEGFGAVMTSGCDMPVFPVSLGRALQGDSAAIVEGHQLLGFWPSALADRLDAYLAGGDDRSIRGWMAITGPRLIACDVALPNINRPEELMALSRIARSPAGPDKPNIESRDGDTAAGMTGI